MALPPGIRQQTLVVVFVDICESTRLYETHGDAVARARIRTLFDALRATAESNGGRVIKEIGDAALVVFEQMPGALALAQALPGIHEQTGLQCKTGVHAGEVIVERGDVFGDAVNTAARIEAMAAPGQVLFSEEALEALGDTGRPEVRALPTAMARGKRAMPALFELLDTDADYTQAVDGTRLEALRQSLATRLRLSWPGERLELAPGCGDVTFGRGDGNSVSLALPRVSRTHLRIESRGAHWLVHDQSTNGTLLCGDGAQPVMLQRDQHRLEGRGALQLAPSRGGGADIVIRYEILVPDPG